MAFGFQYYTPTKVVFGRDTELKVGELVKAEGAHKVLIHYGGQSAVRSGLLDRVKQSLEKEAIPYVTLGGVVPNPRISKVYEGVSLCAGEGVDFILAVGGGSVIDSAKAIGYGVYNGGDVWDFYAKKREPKGCLPIGVVLTIAASGSEMSRSSVITDDRTGLKTSCNTDYIRPRFAVMNPALTVTLPDYQTEAGCADIMMHTMERYMTGGGNMELTDAIAEGLLRTVMKNAKILHENPSDYDARAEVMWAGSLSHNGLTGCGNGGDDFSCHALEHPLSGTFDVTHGAGLTAVWGSWARYVYKECLPRFVKFALNVPCVEKGDTDEETALRGIEAMESFFREIGMPVSIKELGVSPTEEQLDRFAAESVMMTGGKKGSAKVLYKEDMRRIYEMALG